MSMSMTVASEMIHAILFPEENIMILRKGKWVGRKGGRLQRLPQHSD